MCHPLSTQNVFSKNTDGFTESGVVLEETQRNREGCGTLNSRGACRTAQKAHRMWEQAHTHKEVDVCLKWSISCCLWRSRRQWLLSSFVRKQKQLCCPSEMLRFDYWTSCGDLHSGLPIIRKRKHEKWESAQVMQRWKVKSYLSVSSWLLGLKWWTVPLTEFIPSETRLTLREYRLRPPSVM